MKKYRKMAESTIVFETLRSVYKQCRGNQCASGTSLMKKSQEPTKSISGTHLKKRISDVAVTIVTKNLRLAPKSAKIRELPFIPKGSQAEVDRLRGIQKFKDIILP